MTAITIGVPVYNGAEFLEGSLACLARQTFHDFKVLIFDNASTDGTAAIARAWASRDSRFHYIRQPTNVGGMNNERDSLLAADTKWFMWRADDDLSDDNYVQALYALATSSPGCTLAAATGVLTDWDLTPQRVVEPPANLDPASLGGRIRGLLASGPPWYYGLWDRETLRAALLGVLENFPYPYASDHLTLYGPIIDGGLRTTSVTRIIMRTRRAPAAKRQGGRTPFKVMWEIRRGFVRNLRRIRSERELSPGLRLALLLVEPYYVRHRLTSWTKLLRRGLRDALGQSGQQGTSWHVRRNG
jgi:glycosyltransferase involved in cell wall biosynthesis